MPSTRFGTKASSLVAAAALTVVALAACGQTFTEGSPTGPDASASAQDSGTSPGQPGTSDDAATGVVDPDADVATDAGTGGDSMDSGPLPMPDGAPTSPPMDSGIVSTCSCNGPSCSACGTNCCNDATEFCYSGGCIAKATTGNDCFTMLDSNACVEGDVCAPIGSGKGICAKTCKSASDCAATGEPCVAYDFGGGKSAFICQCNGDDICDDGQTCKNKKCM